MSSYNTGDRIFSRRHRSGEIHVDVAGSRVLLGRIIRKDGTPGGREVVVPVGEVTHRWPLLPGIGGDHAS